MIKLLVATDLSARSDRALHRAIELAHRLGAPLEVVHVVDDTVPESMIAEQETSARTLVGQLIASVPSSAGIKVAVEIARGHPYEAILQRASAIRAGLIVLGITRHGVSELFHGTTAERVVRLGQFPVLLVKDIAAEAYRRVLVATDNSPSAQRALACAIQAAPDAEFFLLHAIHVPFKGLLGARAQEEIRAEQKDHFTRRLEDEFKAIAAGPDGVLPKSNILIEEGEIHDVIRTQIARIKPDLLAFGTHGRAGLRQLLIGSVAADLLSNPPVDVLTAKV